jgi:SAM-dependent methyltransferase
MRAPRHPRSLARVGRHRNHAAFFREVERVLAPGGRFAFQDHSLPEHTATGVFVDSFERLRDPSHVRARSGAEWIAAVEAAGLVVDRHETVEMRYDFIEWCMSGGCDIETMAALTAHARRLPRMAVEWLSPEWRDDTDPETPLASQRRALLGFTNRHVVMLARKPAA